MKLSHLIEDCKIIHCDLDLSMDISSINSRAQDIKPGDLFIAIKGFAADGHDYINQAFKNGCSAVIAQNSDLSDPRIIQVADSRKAMAQIASKFYGAPSDDLVLIGITGTNGKTTTTYLIESILKTCGFNPGVIGTINIRYNGQEFDNPITTPDAIDLQSSLARMKKGGVTHVILEVSSHSIELCRVDCCHFDIGIFTNLSQDHLDFHGNMKDYFNCKKSFFTLLLEKQALKKPIAIINIDDPKGLQIANEISIRTISTAVKNKASVGSKNIIDEISGLSGSILIDNKSFHFKSQLTGNFNLENILNAVASAHALGINHETIKKGIENCTLVPGRLEKVLNNISRYIFVDYAHTPDALESILDTLKQRAPARIITLVGCGGDRDRKKRPLMGQIAVKYSDITIVTSDNPRTEDPDIIISDIVKGIKECESQEFTYSDILDNPKNIGFLIEADRKKALQTAVDISLPEDIIVAAGKGHETYQITNNGTIHFDDREELMQAVKNFESTSNQLREKV